MSPVAQQQYHASARRVALLAVKRVGWVCAWKFECGSFAVRPTIASWLLIKVWCIYSYTYLQNNNKNSAASNEIDWRTTKKLSCEWRDRNLMASYCIGRWDRRLAKIRHSSTSVCARHECETSRAVRCWQLLTRVKLLLIYVVYREFPYNPPLVIPWKCTDLVHGIYHSGPEI